MTVSSMEFRWITIVVILTMTVVATFLPLKLRTVDPHRRDAFLAFFSFFTGGVFLGAGMCHMLPDAAEQLKGVANGFPVAYLICAIGFLGIWSVDKIQIGGETKVCNH